MKKYAVLAGIAGLFALGIVFAGLAMAQTSSGGDQLAVTLSDTSLQVSPADAPINVNTPFTVSVQNSGTFTYSLVLEKPGDINKPLSVGGVNTRIDNIAPSGSQTATWTIDTAGIYQLDAYTDTNATTAPVLTATVVVSTVAVTSPVATTEVTGTVAATETSAATATVAATDTPAATATVAATDTPAATATAAATDTPAATATLAATDTPAAAAAVTNTVVATETVSATKVVTGTAEATLPQTGGPDDSLPMGLILITFGTLFVVGGLLVGRKLAHR